MVFVSFTAHKVFYLDLFLTYLHVFWLAASMLDEVINAFFIFDHLKLLSRSLFFIFLFFFLAMVKDIL